jgi:hypothetical protein
MEPYRIAQRMAVGSLEELRQSREQQEDVWFRLLSVYARCVDESFDLNDFPAFSIPPPFAVDEGFVFGFEGPEVLTQEEAQKRYEAASQANLARVTKRKIQFGLSRIRDAILWDVKMFAIYAYSHESRGLDNFFNRLDQRALPGIDRDRLKSEVLANALMNRMPPARGA